jgi:hypothetical protein
MLEEKIFYFFKGGAVNTSTLTFFDFNGNFMLTTIKYTIGEISSFHGTE